jgi:hypothetical protein
MHELPQTGPDGWPYLLVRSSPTASEPARQMLGWLSEKGIGLAINTHKNIPDYVFTYGMIWNFRERAQFVTAAAHRSSGTAVFENDQEVKFGRPIASFFPPYVARVLIDFFKNLGVEHAKVLLMGSETDGYDLCFSLESLGSPPNEEHEGILKTLAWFFPTHYSLVLISEKNLPRFIEVSELAGQ